MARAKRELTGTSQQPTSDNEGELYVSPHTGIRATGLNWKTSLKPVLSCFRLVVVLLFLYYMETFMVSRFIPPADCVTPNVPNVPNDFNVSLNSNSHWFGEV
ncbi:Uncharacterized protein APZ42_006509 [Daphnia magna]|uniref:Uncharacterized protein n=1 Tax=Daphnia magna TaxID=35525 RepID=A0A162BVY0_9CRUS|nr:Uncharacterized protein APZ42_006509 [Daphnia magna]